MMIIFNHLAKNWKTHMGLPVKLEIIKLTKIGHGI